MGDTYPADETGFTFHEFEDCQIAIGESPQPAESDRRWEGVFWTWHRRVTHNSGSPIQVWNVRREYMPGFSGKREVYYSPADQRLHMRGAREGWIRIGMITKPEPMGETRIFDTDGDGYFDLWEHYTPDSGRPYRTDRVPGAVNVDFGSDWDKIAAFYTGEVLPKAIQVNETFIAAIAEAENVDAPEAPVNLNQALERDLAPAERRYILDLIREHSFRHFEAEVLEQTRPALEALAKDEEYPRGMFSRGDNGPVVRRELRLSEIAWKIETTLTEMREAYGAGKIGEAAEFVGAIDKMLENFEGLAEE